MNSDLDTLLEAVRARHERFGPDDEGKQRLLDHLRNLARMDEEPLDYDQGAMAGFPERVLVAFAVCHPECGRREFIVEGSTQACQRCGGLMFRTETRWYRMDLDTAEQGG
jgi:hypothetical protein